MDKVLLMSLGSRGDMEPFLALGEELKENGHEIAFCFPAQFNALAQEVSPNFYPMTPAFLELLDDPDVKSITGQIGSGWKRIRTIFKLLRSTKPIQQQLIKDQKEAVDRFAPDRIVFHIKCIYPIVAALRKQQSVELLSPVPCLLHPVHQEPAIGFGSPKSAWWNKMTYHISNSALINQAILGYANPVLESLDIKPLKKKELKRYLLEELPVEFAIDQRLFPRPKEWPAHVRISQFRERNKSKHWTPSAELLSFLESHPNPLYIGFGSMVNGRPKQIGSDILEVTKSLHQPVLINSSWGGIEIEGTLPDHAFMVSDIPYDWLFEKVSAVVHHGGSGTTHSALRFERRQLIIPHIGDQFLWNRLIHRAGYGPLGFPIKKWSKTQFSAALQALRQD